MMLKFTIRLKKSIANICGLLNEGDTTWVVMDLNDQDVLNISFDGKDFKRRSTMEMLKNGYIGSRGQGECLLYKFPEDCEIVSIEEYK